MKETIYIINFYAKEPLLPMQETYLASELEKQLGATVSILTIAAWEDPSSYERLVNRTRNNSKIIFWAEKPIATAPVMQKLIGLSTALRGRKKTYFGGFIASCFKDKIIYENLFDYVITGNDMKKVPKKLQQKNRIINVPGYCNINEYEFSLNYVFEKNKLVSNNAIHGYYTTHSCPNNCYYCYNNFMKNCGAKYIEKDIDIVKRELKHISKELDFKYIFMKDLNFFHNKERAVKILEIIKDLDKSITGNLDITLNAIDEEVMSEISRFNVKGLFFGLESVNSETLRKLNKNANIKKLQQANKLAKKYEMELNCNIIMGLPWQKSKDINKIVKESIKLMDKYNSIYIRFVPYIPIYGTEIQKRYFPDYYNKLSFLESVKMMDVMLLSKRNLSYQKKLKDVDLNALFNTSAAFIIATKILRDYKKSKIVVSIIKMLRDGLKKELIKGNYENKLTPIFLKMVNINRKYRFIRR